MGRKAKPLSPSEINSEAVSAFDFDSQRMEPYGRWKRTVIDRTCLVCGITETVSSTLVRGSIKKYGKVTGRCHRCQSVKVFDAVLEPGKKRVNQRGYVQYYAPGHPDARQNGTLLEHRIVMANQLGRALLPGETVHHKNGIRTDNRPSNLELWSTNHPSGQRYTDWSDDQIQTLITHLQGVLQARS
jgi:hypothetical protein